MLFQIWENEWEGSVTLCQKGCWEAKLHRLQAIAYKLGLSSLKTQLLAEFDAKTRLEACQKEYEVMGWGEYLP